MLQVWCVDVPVCPLGVYCFPVLQVWLTCSCRTKLYHTKRPPLRPVVIVAIQLVGLLCLWSACSSLDVGTDAGLINGYKVDGKILIKKTTHQTIKPCRIITVLHIPKPLLFTCVSLGTSRVSYQCLMTSQTCVTSLLTHTLTYKNWVIITEALLSPHSFFNCSTSSCSQWVYQLLWIHFHSIVFQVTVLTLQGQVTESVVGALCIVPAQGCIINWAK